MNDKSVQIQIQFTNYETAFILQHLICHIERVKRNFPHLHFQCPTLTRNHPLVQFKPKQSVQIPVYDLYTLNVEMVQSFNPQTRVYFTGKLSNARKIFPSSYPVTSNTLQPQLSFAQPPAPQCYQQPPPPPQVTCPANQTTAPSRTPVS